MGKGRKSKCLITDEGRECSKCHVFMLWDKYHKSKSHYHGHHSACIECNSKRERKTKKKRKKYRIEDAGRECFRCGVFKEWDCFYKHPSGPRGHNGVCRECERKKCIERKYNIVYGEYERMYSEQDGLCAVCGIKEKDARRVLAVDHNHLTGQVRGLLCDKCNMALGLLQDSVPIVEQLLLYLKED